MVLLTYDKINRIGKECILLFLAKYGGFALKKHYIKKIVSSILVISLLTSCGSSSNPSISSSNSKTSPYEDFIVVDVFDSLANFQGIQSGWFAKIVEEKFNMKLNIIAPNVAGGGDTLYEIRSAAGNLGDLIICTGENGKLQDLVTSGLIMDMSGMLEDKDIMQYEYSINLLNDNIEENGIYAIPSEISLLPATTSSEAIEPTYGPYLRWDLYEQIGYPSISTLEDLLPVLKEMQTVYPYTEAGNKTYSFSFFKDWDGNLMNAVKQPACFYGYDEFGFVLAKADGSDYQSIIDDDSLYTRILKFYFDANQLGLVDPESITQNSEILFNKYKDGSILYSPWPWYAQSAFNTIENMENGIGYMIAPIDDLEIFSYGCSPEGNQKNVIAIGSNAQDPQRLADFIDWLYSPEGIMINCAQASGGAAGPEGLTWELKEDGPYLTEFGLDAFFSSDAQVPEEWGGGTWEDGISSLNYKPVSQVNISPNGYPYFYTLWDSVISMEETQLDLNWSEFTGSDSTMDYLQEHNKILVAPGCSYVSSEKSSELSTIRSQCRTVIVDYSWKLVFASTEEDFYTLLSEMQTKVTALGYESVFAQDLEEAKELDFERKLAAQVNLGDN